MKSKWFHILHWKLGCHFWNGDTQHDFWQIQDWVACFHSTCQAVESLHHYHFWPLEEYTKPLLMKCYQWWITKIFATDTGNLMETVSVMTLAGIFNLFFFFKKRAIPTSALSQSWPYNQHGNWVSPSTWQQRQTCHMEYSSRVLLEFFPGVRRCHVTHSGLSSNLGLD